jgi:hypothetical protein
VLACLSTAGCRCTEVVTSGGTTVTVPALTADPATVRMAVTTSGNFPLIRRPGALHVARKTVLGVVGRGNIAQTVFLVQLRAHTRLPPAFSDHYPLIPSGPSAVPSMRRRAKWARQHGVELATLSTLSVEVSIADAQSYPQNNRNFLVSFLLLYVTAQ